MLGINSLARSRLIGGLVVIAVALVLILLLTGGSAPRGQQSANNPAQTPLPINNSAAGSGQLQAGGVDLQSSAPASSAASLDSSSQSSVQSGDSASSTPTQPPNGNQDPTYPHCYSCTPGPGRMCPLVACPEGD